MKAKRPPPLNLSEPEASVEAPDNDLVLSAMERAGDDPSTAWPRQTSVSNGSEVAAPEPAEPAREVAAPVSPPRDNARLIYGLASLTSLLWAALAVFAYGYHRPLSGIDYQPFQTAVFIVLILAPVGFIWIFAYGLRQTSRIATEVARAQALSRTMLQPAALAATETGSVLQTVRGEIESATQAAARARQELTALREMLSEETARLSGAAALSARTAASLVDTLGRERGELGALAERLDGQASTLADSVARQARMVSEASDLAQAQVGEAETALAARAADLAAAAGQASDAARLASDDLQRQVLRLETASVGVGDQVRSVEEGLTRQRDGLVAVAQGLRADHEDFTLSLEAQQTQLSEQMIRAQTAVSEIATATGEGAEAIRGLSDEAFGRCRELTETLRQERGLLAAGAIESLAAVAEAARFDREAMQIETRAGVELLAARAEEAQALTARHGELARTRIEELSEASFAAGQRAEGAYDARIEEARGLISKSAELIDGAAETMAQSFDGLLESARKAADETRQIDKAFQERVRHNYEMLSEAVRLMGVMGPASRQALRAQMAAEPPVAEAAPPVAETPPPPPRAAAVRTEPRSAYAQEAEAATPPAGLRLRSRLAPTDGDGEVSAVFETAASEQAGWSWQDLLTNMGDATTGDEQLVERLIGEIEDLGLDVSALLPPARVEELAAVIGSGDAEGARLVIRHLAPVAVRKLSRRLLTERSLRLHAERFMRRFESAVAEAAKRDSEAVALLLGSDSGRAYLLFDAAAAGPV